MTDETHTGSSARAGGHRAALLEGAITCLATVGYARTTARRVVAASGTNLGSIAYHFGTIERLRDQALLEAAVRWLDPIVAVARAGGGTREGVEQGLRAFMASLPRQRPVVAGFVEALAHLDRKPELRGRLAAGYDDLRTVIAAATTADDAPDATASLVVAVFDGLMLQWLIDPGRIGDGSELVDALSPALARLVP